MRRLTSWIAIGCLMAGALVVGLGGVAGAQSGAVYRWGVYEGATVNESASEVHPTAVHGLSDVVALAAGNEASYALEGDGAEYSWGNGRVGELGNGSKTAYSSRPVRVAFPAGTDIEAIGEGNGWAVAADAAGHVWAWGETSRAGAACLGGGGSISLRPHRVPGLRDVTAVAGASSHVLFLESSGKVYECDQADHAPSLKAGLPSGVRVTAVSAGDTFLSVLLVDGEIWNWGDGSHGQLGNGTFRSASGPVEVHLPAETTATQIYAGGSTAANGQEIALLDTGAVVAWGANADMQLGTGTTTAADTPTYVKTPAGVTFTYVATGGATSYGLDSAGRLWSWGANAGGSAGTGHGTGNVYPPRRIDRGVTLVSTTAANVLDYHTG